MRKSDFVGLVLGFLAVAACAGIPLSSSLAHEGHKMECNETSINAMNADIQAMPDGDAKTTATKEMQMAEAMMAKKDMDDCETHMDNAMDATEK